MQPQQPRRPSTRERFFAFFPSSPEPFCNGNAGGIVTIRPARLPSERVFQCQLNLTRRIGGSSYLTSRRGIHRGIRRGEGGRVRHIEEFGTERQGALARQAEVLENGRVVLAV